MNLFEIADSLKQFDIGVDRNEFLYDFLAVYDSPKSTIKSLRTSKLVKRDDSRAIKKRLYFREVDKNPHSVIDELLRDSEIMKHSPRFIIVTDYKDFLAVDTRHAEDRLAIPITEISRNAEFFLPWIGIEKYNLPHEQEADIKASYKMAKLYDQVVKDNPGFKEHDLNIFFARLLFCFFAEDTGMFPSSFFMEHISSHTQKDGSDLDKYIDSIFDALNMKSDAKQPAYLKDFPYVNGGLFKDKHLVPKFGVASRKLIVECGSMNWSQINPDIFGSMMQAVIDQDRRADFGMHYTSVSNIMKVIKPLFLDELYEKLAEAGTDSKKLKQLWNRISDIKFFDPACGSGNFLITAYKELRLLEMKIIQALKTHPTSTINLDNFYGIEIDDFACELAKVSLWLAEHQMNTVFEAMMGKTIPTLPLKEGGHIVCTNACRINWEEVCPKSKDDEIYVFGNPPYLGGSLQTSSQKEDMNIVFGSDSRFKLYKELDYIACWFLKASQYIYNYNVNVAFVSTNSVTQGQQVPLLWENLLSDIDISFAHTSFKWTNNAKYKAGVTVVIIGMSNKSDKIKLLYEEEQIKKVSNINGYLADYKNIVVNKVDAPYSKLPATLYGSKAADGGYLVLSDREKNSFVETNPDTSYFIKKYMSADDFINGKHRWCLWIEDKDLDKAMSFSSIVMRTDSVRAFRLKSKKTATLELAKVPHRFAEARYQFKNAIIIPCVSSEKRTYIPIGFVDKNTVITNAAQAIYDPEPWVFAVITSKMHMAWVRAVAGRLGDSLRYSAVLCYNTFPFPDITKTQKETLSQHTLNVLTEREKHTGQTLAWMYNPETMPAGLKKAHEELDRAVELCYRSKPFENDAERLSYLFSEYEKMINKEKKNA